MNVEKEAKKRAIEAGITIPVDYPERPTVKIPKTKDDDYIGYITLDYSEYIEDTKQNREKLRTMTFVKTSGYSSSAAAKQIINPEFTGKKVLKKEVQVTQQVERDAYNKAWKKYEDYVYDCEKYYEVVVEVKAEELAKERKEYRVKCIQAEYKEYYSIIKSKPKTIQTLVKAKDYTEDEITAALEEVTAEE